MAQRGALILLILGAVGGSTGACGDSPAPVVDTGTTWDSGPDGHPPDARVNDAQPGQLVFSASFDGDAATWPAPWTPAGGVAVADVQTGRARLVPVLSAYSLARMVAPGNETDVDATFELEFEELATQGIGYYVRQNGGYLEQTNPVGAGYAVFVEGFRGTPAIGLWRERDGHEEQLAGTDDPTPGMQSGVVYCVRFRVEQGVGETLLRAKIWPSGQAEPAAWAVQVTDATPALQNLSGGYAFDAWSSRTSGPTPPNIFLDELRVERP